MIFEIETAHSRLEEVADIVKTFTRTYSLWERVFGSKKTRAYLEKRAGEGRVKQAPLDAYT